MFMLNSSIIIIIIIVIVVTVENNGCNAVRIKEEQVTSYGETVQRKSYVGINRVKRQKKKH